MLEWPRCSTFWEPFAEFDRFAPLALCGIPPTKPQGDKTPLTNQNPSAVSQGCFKDVGDTKRDRGTPGTRVEEWTEKTNRRMRHRCSTLVEMGGFVLVSVSDCPPVWVQTIKTKT